jgi:hypothetical protein
MLVVPCSCGWFVAGGATSTAAGTADATDGSRGVTTREPSVREYNEEKLRCENYSMKDNQGCIDNNKCFLSKDLKCKPKKVWESGWWNPFNYNLVDDEEYSELFKTPEGEPMMQQKIREMDHHWIEVYLGPNVPKVYVDPATKKNTMVRPEFAPSILDKFFQPIFEPLDTIPEDPIPDPYCVEWGLKEDKLHMISCHGNILPSYTVVPEELTLYMLPPSGQVIRHKTGFRIKWLDDGEYFREYKGGSLIQQSLLEFLPFFFESAPPRRRTIAQL